MSHLPPRQLSFLVQCRSRSGARLTHVTQHLPTCTLMSHSRATRTASAVHPPRRRPVGYRGVLLDHGADPRESGGRLVSRQLARRPLARLHRSMHQRCSRIPFESVSHSVFQGGLSSVLILCGVVTAAPTANPQQQKTICRFVTVMAVAGGESKFSPQDCRQVIVGPGVNQPDPSQMDMFGVVESLFAGRVGRTPPMDSLIAFVQSFDGASCLGDVRLDHGARGCYRRSTSSIASRNLTCTSLPFTVNSNCTCGASFGTGP